MGQINLYKIDENKKDDFLNKLTEKFEFIGEQDYNSMENEKIVYTVGTYVNIPEERKPLEWQWILDEYDYEIEGVMASPRAVLVIEGGTVTYAVTYGLSYFAVDKYCDIDFAFDFARRISFKQIKTTTLTAPNAQRNKMINVYLNYRELSFDSGESYAKIKAKMTIEKEFTLHGELGGTYMAFDFGNANEAQRSAISTIDGPLLIIAGPGTGKTYTLVKRIVYLITEKDVLPEEIMIATFTEKAAKELITRITNELYAIGVFVNLNEMYIGTFHSICLRILKDHLEYTRIKKNYRMLDNFEQQYMVFQKINRFRNLPCFDVIFDKKQGAWRQAGEIVKYVNNLAEELVDIDEMQGDADEHIVAVANIMKQYNTLMEDENLIDFSSIQTEAYKLLIEKPSILEEIQQKIKYVMVDEYQDTNYIQELLVFLIAGKNKNICVVGDDDQGLYRFRGATIRNILEFPGHFAEGECKQVKLVTNYRSERQIIDFYNKWMSTTDGRAYDFMWKNFRFEKKIVPPEGKKDAKVGVIKCSGRDLLDDWYEQVYSFITQLKSSGVLTDYNQIAVLCKSVKGDKIIGMVEYLEEHGIKVYSPRSEMFFERKEIKQVIGCMILCFPEYVRKLQQRDFSYDFENLYKYYDTQCIAAARKLILQYRDTLGKWIAEKMHKHANLRRDNADYAFTGLLYQLLQFEPFSTYLGIDMKSGVIDERPARNLSILSSILGKYEYLHRIDVFTEKNIIESVERFFNMYFRFLFDGGITEYEDDSEYAPSGCVSFMTIHQSKGMEFPIHRAAMRHEEQTIVPETIREWFDTNYMTLSKCEHSYLGQPQIEAAYKQVLRYVERNQSDWSRIQDAEVEVSLVKPDYILLGKVDLIRGEGDTVEIVDFKSEKKPDVLIETAEMNRYRRQLEVYAHLIEEKTGKKVSKMHLYYTGEDNGVPTVTFNKSTEMIDKTIKEFDAVVEKIQRKDFSGRAKDKNLCANCDMRHYCRRKGDC